MNIRILIIALLATALGTGVAYQLLHKASRSQRAGTAPEQHVRKTFPKRNGGGTERDVRPEPLPRPKPPAERTGEITPVNATPPSARKQTDRQPPKPLDPAQYWARQARRFDGLLEQFTREQDPARREALIRALAAYVRIDTLETIEWAMGLKDPIEQRAALEAINRSSLSGIGARIETDDTGFPVIRETTVLSAIAATGLVEPGDYIVGIVAPDGQPVSFENLSTRQVVKYLRGQPGSEVELLIERLPSDENSESQAFAVPIQRSLLVVQPPY